MSGTVDEEVVRMRFDNSAFSRGVASTIGLLSKLKSSLSFNGADKGLNSIENKASKFNMDGVNKAVDESARHWSAWRTAGLIAFATVVHRAVNAGINVVKAFTINPITAGFKNYETQINAVQTILANTGLKGKAGLDQVNGALNQLNTYANQTVYNFSEMAKNIGTFTAAGVKLKPAANAIKGIANLAALSGSTSDQASTAMYQLSQAIAANKVGLQDWNSVVNAGMGGKVFQNALFNVGKLRGTLKGVKANETFDQWTKAGNSFRGSLQKGWITGQVLTDTLSQFTGDLTDAQLKAQGYNATQIKQIQELAKTASGAATHIKTLTQLQDALKEEVASAYGAIFKTIFGDINGATALFSGIHTVVENALTVPIYALNTLLKQVTALGGRAKAIDAFKNVFKSLGVVMHAVTSAFREIFPPTSAKQITEMITRFDAFTQRLRDVVKTAAGPLKRTFAGFFAIFDIAKQVIMGVVDVVGNLFGALTHGVGGGVLAFTAHIGDMIVAFDKALKSGGALRGFFQRLGPILATPIVILHQLAAGLAGMFGGFKIGDANGVTRGLDIVNRKLDAIGSVTDKIKKAFSKLPAAIKPGIDAVVHAVSNIGHAIAQGLSSQSFENVLKIIQVSLLGGLVLMVKKFFSKGINVDIGGGMFGKAKEALEGVTGSLKAMQTQLKAKALLEIAIALGVLTASVVALSFVKSDKIASSLKAMAVGFGELLASMAILTKIGGVAGALKLPVVAGALNLLASSILILAGAVKVLSSMSWDELTRGLSAVGILLAEVTAAAILISKNSGSMIAAGLGIEAMAVAITILAGAVKLFSLMKWQDIGKGLAGVGGALAAVAIGMRLMPPEGMIATSVGLLAIGVAINAIYLAVKNFSGLSWKDMAKGLVGVSAALAGIALAMHLMPPGMILQAAGLALIAGSLTLIEKVMVSMAKLSWGTIAKGLGSIALTLGVLAAAMAVMDGAIPGAVALGIATLALSKLMPVIQNLGQQSWGDIAKGLITFAAGLTILLLAAAGAELVIPGLIALSVAALAIGAGLALAGLGLGAFAAGLGLLAASGSAGIAVLIEAITAVIAKIPALALAFAQGLIDILLVIGKNGPTIVKAISTILSSVLNAIIKNAPLMAKAFTVLIDQALGVITKEAPKIIAAGLQILMDLLTGIRNNIGRIVKTVADIIVNFLNALADNLPRIINAGVNLLTKFLLGVASALGRIPNIAVRVVIVFVGSLLSNSGKMVGAGLTMLGHVIGGIGSGLGRMVTAGLNAVGRFIRGFGSNVRGLISAGRGVLSNIVTGVRNGISSAVSSVYNMAKDIGSSIVSGIIDGVKGLASSLTKKLTGAVGGAMHAVGSVLHIGGPSKLFADEVGKPIVWGISDGITQNAHMINTALKKSTTSVFKNISDSFSAIPDAISNMNELSPTITPVLDLSNVQKDASKISGMVAAKPITATASFDSAAFISAEQQASKTAEAESTTPEAAAPASITFAQTNNSPKALSTSEIYRQTNNLISQAKAALKIPAPTPTS